MNQMTLGQNKHAIQDLTLVLPRSLGALWTKTFRRCGRASFACWSKSQSVHTYTLFFLSIMGFWHDLLHGLQLCLQLLNLHTLACLYCVHLFPLRLSMGVCTQGCHKVATTPLDRPSLEAQQEHDLDLTHTHTPNPSDTLTKPPDSWVDFGSILSQCSVSFRPDIECAAIPNTTRHEVPAQVWPWKARVCD